MKLSRNEVVMAPYMHECVSARSAQGRIQGRAKIGHRGVPFKKTSYSDWKATATNRINSNVSRSMQEEVLLFLVPFKSQVLNAFSTHFRRLFGLTHFGVF